MLNERILDDKLAVFSTDMTTAYAVTPSMLAPTVGSKTLIQQADILSVSNRHKLVVCSQFSTTGSCLKGESCGDVHITVPLQETLQTIVHHNDGYKAHASKYAVHEAGTRIDVWNHRTRQTTTVDSSYLYVTQGSLYYMEGLLQVPIMVRRMQQCSHFQKGLCAEGSRCRFLHVTVYPPPKQRQPTIAMQPQTFLVPPPPAPAPLPFHTLQPIPCTIQQQPPLQQVVYVLPYPAPTTATYW